MAERCLVAICAHLSMTMVRDDNFAMWVGVLRDLGPACVDGHPAMVGLVDAAAGVANAVGCAAQNNAMARLRTETKTYFTKVAADRVDAWRAERGAAA